MVYIKVDNQYKTLKEISEEYDCPLRLVAARFYRGIREINELTQPKYDMLRK